MEHGSCLALDLSQRLYANGLFGVQPVVHEISPRVSERMLFYDVEMNRKVPKGKYWRC
jgi:hypothetical protein